MMMINRALFLAMAGLASASLAQSLPNSALPGPGRPVAKIVSPAWDDEDRRDLRGEFSDVVKALALKPGQTVADIGAGSGYYAMRLSPILGQNGRVIAQDVVSTYLEQLKQRARAEKLTNISFVRGTQSDARLPAGAVDVALMVHMYHEIAQPYVLLTRLRASLKPGGRVAIVDLEREPQFHGMPRKLLVCEMQAVGYELRTIKELNVGYVAIFRLGQPKAPGAVRACRR